MFTNPPYGVSGPNERGEECQTNVRRSQQSPWGIAGQTSVGGGAFNEVWKQLRLTGQAEEPRSYSSTGYDPSTTFHPGISVWVHVQGFLRSGAHLEVLATPEVLDLAERRTPVSCSTHQHQNHRSNARLLFSINHDGKGANGS